MTLLKFFKTNKKLKNETVKTQETSPKTKEQQTFNYNGCFLIALLFSVFLQHCSSNRYFKKPPVVKSGIAISLNKLTDKVISDIDSDIPISNDVFHFCGMNRIYGYAIDDKNSDVILIGGRMESSNDILLDDFCITLRNAWNETTPPGCSIDPRPKEMNTLGDLMKKMNKYSDEFIQDRILSKWIKSAEYESVRVLGISKNTSFAKTIIDADYLMKKISNGTHPVKIFGFKSFNQMMLENSMNEYRRHGALEQKQILSRFWFFPDSNYFLTTTNALYLKNSSVKLLTEEEYWSENGERIGKGKPHPVADRFVKMFTENYQQIAYREPVYAQLETLFRMVVIQKLLKEKNAGIISEDALDFWLNNYQLSTVVTPDSVRSLYTFNRLYKNIGNKRLSILSPMAGGVTISPEITAKCFKEDQTGSVDALKSLVFSSRPADKSVFWYFDIPSSLSTILFDKRD